MRYRITFELERTDMADAYLFAHTMIDPNGDGTIDGVVRVVIEKAD